MISDLLRFESEYRRKGAFEHNLIEANAALGVSSLLLGEVLAYRVAPDPAGGYTASVGATLVLLDSLTTPVWQQSKNVSEHSAGAPDLPAVAARLADELVESMPD